MEAATDHYLRVQLHQDYTCTISESAMTICLASNAPVQEQRKHARAGSQTCIVLKNINQSTFLLFELYVDLCSPLSFSTASFSVFMATVVSNTGEVAVQQDSPATVNGFGHAVGTAIKAGKLGEVPSLLRTMATGLLHIRPVQALMTSTI